MKKIFLALAIFAAVAVTASAQSDITGVWKDGSVGSVGYQNQVTGVTRSGRSHVFTYKFLPNGNYEFVGYMELNMYNCTTTLFNDITGKYTVDGSTIYLTPSKDYWKSTNSCAASGNKETTRPGTKKTLEFETRKDDWGRDLLCIQDGQAQACYRKE